MTAPTSVIRPSELEVLTLVAAGLTHREIARCLNVTTSAVHQRLHRLYVRIGARSAAHAVAITIRTGQLPTEEPAR
jgi:DNA-binding CsgD family transcriptional regulator